jgi:hypothetical protein
MDDEKVVRGTCKKCGYSGHLSYQCRNFLQLKSSSTSVANAAHAPPVSNIILDVSSTSSDDPSDNGLTPLQKLNVSEHKKKKRKKTRKRKEKDCKGSSSGASSDDEESKHERKPKKKSGKKKKEIVGSDKHSAKKRRRKSSQSS